VNGKAQDLLKTTAGALKEILAEMSVYAVNCATLRPQIAQSETSTFPLWFKGVETPS
jgi:hypothetical protein